MLEQSVSTQEISSHDEGHRIYSRNVQSRWGSRNAGQSERVHEISDHDKGHRMPEQSERIQDWGHRRL